MGNIRAGQGEASKKITAGEGKVDLSDKTIVADGTVEERGFTLFCYLTEGNK